MALALAACGESADPGDGDTAAATESGSDGTSAGPGTSAARDMPDGRSPVPGGWNRVVVEVDDIDDLTGEIEIRDVLVRGRAVPGVDVKGPAYPLQ